MFYGQQQVLWFISFSFCCKQNTGYDQGGVLYFQVATLLSNLDEIQPTGLVPAQVLAQVGNYVCPMHTAVLIMPVPLPIDEDAARKKFTFRKR
jgi:hypothetical protein